MAETQEVATPTAAAPKPDPRDAELAQLRERAQTYEQQLGQVQQLVQAGRLVLKEEKPAVAHEPEDDMALVDRSELKRAVDEIKASAANVIVETATHSARQMRGLTKEQLRGSLANFGKYESEIDALLDKIPDPRIAASPETLKQVHKLVRSQHIDEEREEQRAQDRREIEQELRDKYGFAPDQEEVEEVLEAREDAATDAGARESARQAAPTARSAGVAPAGNASGARLASARRQAAAPALTRDQRVMADVFGISGADEWHRYADPKWRPDTMGFKGKRKI